MQAAFCPPRLCLPRFHPTRWHSGTLLPPPLPITLHVQHVPQCRFKPTHVIPCPRPPTSPGTPSSLSGPLQRPPLRSPCLHSWLTKLTLHPAATGSCERINRATPPPCCGPSVPIHCLGPPASPAPTPASFTPSYAGVTLVLQAHQPSPCLRAFALAPFSAWYALAELDRGCCCPRLKFTSNVISWKVQRHSQAASLGSIVLSPPIAFQCLICGALLPTSETGSICSVGLVPVSQTRALTWETGSIRSAELVPPSHRS